MYPSSTMEIMCTLQQGKLNPILIWPFRIFSGKMIITLYNLKLLNNTNIILFLSKLYLAAMLIVYTTD